MRKIVFFCLCLITCVSVVAQEYTYESVPNDPMGVRIYTLANGLKVYLSVNREQPRIAAHIAVNTGSRNDPTEYTGLAHYLEHLMFKGSHLFGTTDYEKEKPYLDQITALYEEYGTLTDSLERKAKYHEIDSVSQLAAQYNIPNEYDKMMAMIGSIGTNAYTSFDETCYTEDIPSNEVDRWARVQADRFQNLVLRGFHTELEAVYEEKNISLSSDVEKAFDAALAKLFPTHSYGTQTTLGTQDHLKNPSLIAIQDYYNRYYVPNNIAIVMAGDLDPDETIRTIDKYFGAWIPGQNALPREFDPQPLFTTPQDTIVVGQEQEMLIMGWRFEGASNLQADTLQVLAKVLYNERAGLLDLDVSQKMLVQDCSTFVLGLKDYSALFFQGTPNQGQSLEEMRDIFLAEVDKLKRGEWDESLLTAIHNNEKLYFLQQIDNNRFRADEMVDAYIDNMDWAQYVGHIERQRYITKDELVAFANRHLTNGYVYVEKRKGEDMSIKKIDKPEITPIPANRDYASDYLTAYAAQTTEPIHPVFIDFDKELTFFNTTNGLPVIYKQNEENALFTLRYLYPFGSAADHRYPCALAFIDRLGTTTLSAAAVQEAFYALACDYSAHVSSNEMSITLTGLQENMPAAVALLDTLLRDAVPVDSVYEQYVQQEIQRRNDAKLEQRSNAQHLLSYGCLGSRNRYTDTMSADELHITAPSTLTTLVRALLDTRYSVQYYGPATPAELDSLLTVSHCPVGTSLIEGPMNRPYEWITTPTSDILFASYSSANNTIIYMYHNEETVFAAAQMPIIYLFNEYFGGGMNSVVFQELRETKGLAYNAWAQYNTPNYLFEPEYLTFGITTQNDKVWDCLQTFADITTDFLCNEQSLDIARTSLMQYLAATRTTKFNVIDTYLWHRRHGLTENINRLLYEQIPLLTMDDLLRFARENIIGKPLRYMILGNEEDLDMEALKTLGPLTRLPLDALYAK